MWDIQDLVKILRTFTQHWWLKARPRQGFRSYNFPAPNNITKSRRFLGMVNQLGKFIPNLAEMTKPLQDLVSQKNAFVWQTEQKRAFSSIKEILCSASVLSLYSPRKRTVLSADDSSYDLGAVLLQQQEDGKMHLVAYASRAMSGIETRYAQIEKEALAITWRYERFSDYLIGLEFTIETDHNSFVPLRGNKDINELPASIRLMKFSFKIHHVSGKNLYTTDVLSRATPGNMPTNQKKELEVSSTMFAQAIMNSLPATNRRLAELRETTSSDDKHTHYELRQKEWPTKNQVPMYIKRYGAHRGEITWEEGLLMYGTQIIVPQSMRPEIIDKIHSGITRCWQQARQSIWWSGLSDQIKKQGRKLWNMCQAETATNRTV